MNPISRAWRNYLRDRSYSFYLDKDELAENSEALRMYVVVRSDLLPPLNQGIQAAHAIVALFAQASNDSIMRVNNWAKLDHWKRHDRTIILLGAQSDQELRHICQRLSRHKYKHAYFKEPDLGDIMTAAAFEPMTRAEGDRYFWDLRLAS